MSRLSVSLILVLTVFIAAVPEALAGKTPLDGATIVTPHTGVFNGVKVDYTATIGEIVVTDGKGTPAATISSTAYVRKNVRDAGKRPVLFIWNGGPSAASSTLHMAGLGPKRLVVPTDLSTPIEPPYAVEDSPRALLDIADLVFVDPPETGFSRILPGGKRDYFYSADGDAESVAQYIQKWLEAHTRTASPVFILGSSYGSIRAALVAAVLAKSDHPLDGVVLFSQGINLVETTQRMHNLVGYAVNMPQLAAIAHFYGKTAFQNKSVYDLIDESCKYFMGEYLEMLAAGRRLSTADRQRTAKKLAQFTGLSAQFYLENGLRIKKSRFRRELLKDRGLVLAATDARYAFPPKSPGHLPTAGVEDVHRRYLSDFLGAAALVDSYRSFAPDVEDWDYVGSTTIGGQKVPLGSARSVFADYDWTGALRSAFDANPSFRLMIATGIYDTLTTAGPARLLAEDVHLPEKGISVFEYEGGHAFYSNDAEFKRLSGDLRRFLTE